jgi:hypothetical protein
MLNAVGSAKFVPGAIPPLLLIHVAPLGAGIADIFFHFHVYLIKYHGYIKLSRVPWSPKLNVNRNTRKLVLCTILIYIAMLPVRQTTGLQCRFLR